MVSVINTEELADQVTFTLISTDQNDKEISKSSDTSSKKNIVFDLALNTRFKSPVTMNLRIVTTTPDVSIEKILALREYSLNKFLFPEPFDPATTAGLIFRSYYPLSTTGSNKDIISTGTYANLFRAISST